MSPLYALAACALLGCLPATAAHARTSIVYRCDAADGSIAYVSSREGFHNCRVAATFVAPAAARAAPARAPAGPAPAKAATDATVPRQRGWVYEEDKADFSNVAAGVASLPPGVARADFRAVAAGVASSARSIEPQDFSLVLADVASSAARVGVPTFVAAPYRMRRAHPPAVVAPPPRAAAASTARPAPRVLRGAVYKVARQDGITEYTNIRPSSGSAFAVLFTYIATCVACDVNSRIDFARTALNLDAYRDIVAAAAADYGVDRALLRAVIHAESAFNPLAISSKGAQGLMQLMPGTAGDLGVTDAFDVAQNIRGGARYLSQLLQSFNGDARLATAAYNAGPGAVQKYGGVPPYDETQVYVERVATLRDRYQKAL
ncbi:lytic transglycosylase domain-containing protein [Dokdonella sp.]|uniref:lytic transglycosylase domain-containing protein n=1 Tax=Dokdonella sp. TaxID=2291710 RepID=UPI0031C8DAF9|nr:lytic transglycosylase domain-containing protein [Dokdonella sp.]